MVEVLHEVPFSLYTVFLSSNTQRSGLGPYFLVPYSSVHVLTYIMADHMSLLYVDFFTLLTQKLVGGVNTSSPIQTYHTSFSHE